MLKQESIKKWDLTRNSKDVKGNSLQIKCKLQNWSVRKIGYEKEFATDLPVAARRTIWHLEDSYLLL